uniref:Uncharacterized protein n=1 Tax=viral metagenome TaxID=1070528 RepID=A0A6C0JZJ9_9ZZZZ
MSDTSAIDDKTTTSSDTSNTDSNWGTFALLVFRYFIFSIIIIFIGINYIFLLNYKQLDILFPTEMQNYIQTNVRQRGGQPCANCPFSDVDGNKNYDFLGSLGYSIPIKGWPYSLYNSSINTYLQNFKNWFALTEAYSFITFRTIMKYTLQFKGIKNLPQPIIIISGYILFIFGCIFIPIVGFFTSLIHIFSATDYAWFIGILGIIFGYTWVIAYINAIYQLCAFLLNLLIVPSLLNPSLIGRLLQCNLSTFTNIFTVLIVIASWQSLNTTTASMITIAYVIMLIKSYIS